MKQKKFSVSFMNYKVKVQFLVGIPGALGLVLAFLSKTASVPQRQQIHKQKTPQNVFNIYIRLNHIQMKEELRRLRSNCSY